MKMIRLFVSVLALGFILGQVSCSSSSKKEVSLGGKEPSLTQDYAQVRFDQVSDVQYELTFNLNKTDAYSGISKIFFTGKNKSTDLRVDFYEGEVLGVKLNGQTLPIDFNGTYLRIPAKNIAVGKNELVIDFKHKFTTDGNGFHRFVDPEDGGIYTYTNLEPFKANRVFPCFDQPDLKATYKMTVRAPKSWQVITSVNESKIQLDGEYSNWIFPESARFSTYIWSLHAGNYTMFKSQAGDIPLRLFVRKTLAKYVKTEDWWVPTQQGFEFFNEYFKIPYPYKKYDQVIVPEFNFGAMENVGAVTFREGYVHRGIKSRKNRLDLASVILHEMAHMWFGNLVTMKWWDDLWLNESFATYMATLALHEATEFKEAWRDFGGTKGWAYWEDQLPTTHPIEAVIPTTAEAFENFDGITYGKGASSLKQVSFFIGKDNFREGVRRYFNKHSGGNTKLADFMSALQSATKENLTNWQRLWLQTASLNTLHVGLQCTEGSVNELKITQTHLPEYPTLRPHRTRMALIDLVNGSPKVRETIDVSVYGTEKDVSEAVGMKCPDMVFPNYNDYGYFKTSFDEKTLETLGTSIHATADPFLREMMWQSLWSMVRDGKLSVVFVADLLARNLLLEKDPQIIRYFARRMLNEALVYMPKDTDKEKAMYKSMAKKFEEATWKRLLGAKSKSESQKVWYQAFVSIAQTKRGQARLKNLLTGRTKLRGFKVDQDKRWSILIKLSSHKYSGIQKMIDKEEKKDPSATGKKWAMTARAAYPTWEAKSDWVKKMKSKENALSYDNFRAIISSIFPEHQEDLSQQYAEQFFADLDYFEKIVSHTLPLGLEELLRLSVRKEAKGAFQSISMRNRTFDLGRANH